MEATTGQLTQMDSTCQPRPPYSGGCFGGGSSSGAFGIRASASRRSSRPAYLSCQWSGTLWSVSPGTFRPSSPRPWLAIAEPHRHDPSAGGPALAPASSGRPAADRFAGIQHVSDVGMVHEGQGLAFRLKAGDDLACVHARLENLQGDHTADGLSLLGHENHAEAPFPDLFQEFVR